MKPWMPTGTNSRQRPPPNGSIYVEASATEIRARVQELVDLYFPSAITPNPMSFAIAPAAVNATTIGMTATTATAATGPVEYYFENTTNPPTAAGSASPTWNQTGLTTGLSYTFRVKARDGLCTKPTGPPRPAPRRQPTSLRPRPAR